MASSTGARPGLRTRLTVGLVLLVGLLGGLGLSQLFDGDDGDPVPADLPSDLADDAADEPVVDGEPRGEPVPLAERTDAEDVVRAFLDAEVERDFAGSFELLAPADREAFGVEAAWANAHADLPTIESYEITDVRRVGDRLEVTTDVELESVLDEFVGLVPGRAQARWSLVEVEGEVDGEDGLRVAFSESALQPRYPSQDGAVDATREWVTEVQECTVEAAELQGLYGVGALAEPLCGDDGDVELGPVGRLPDGPGAEPLLAAFGEDVFEWARVVPVTAPVAVQVVLAPVDDAWQVIGVLSPEA